MSRKYQRINSGRYVVGGVSNRLKDIEIPEETYKMIEDCDCPIFKVLDLSLCSLRAYRETQGKHAQKT